MRSLVLFLFAVSFLLLSSRVQAQNVFFNKERVIEELEKRGLEYDDVSEELARKGIDLRFLDQSNVTPAEIEVIEEVILAMEQEKKDMEAEDEEEDPEDEEGLDDEILLDSLDMEEPLEEELDDEEEPEILVYGQSLFLSLIHI